MLTNIIDAKLENELLNNLISIIEEYNNSKLLVDKSFKTIWIHDKDYEIEFRYTFLLNKIIISRVLFKNKRNGCMTECLECIKDYCKKMNVDIIIIQSVQTKEMSNFCLKYNFIPNSYCMEFDGIMVGDYELTLNI